MAFFMSVSITHPQSCTKRSQSHVFSSAIGGEVAAHRFLLSRISRLSSQGLPLQKLYFQTAKRDNRFSTAYGHIIGYILSFVHNARNFTGKDCMARENVIRYGLYRKVVKYHLRLGGGPSILVRYGGIYRKYSILQGSGVRTDRLLGVWRAAWYIVRFIICLVVLSEIVLPGYWSICIKIPVMPPRDGVFRKSN